MSKHITPNIDQETKDLFDNPKVIAWYDCFNACLYRNKIDAMLAYQGGNKIYPVMEIIG